MNNSSGPQYRSSAQFPYPTVYVWVVTEWSLQSLLELQRMTEENPDWKTVPTVLVFVVQTPLNV